MIYFATSSQIFISLIIVIYKYWNTILVSSLLDASYEAYASYEYSFLTYFFGSATWLSGYMYFKKYIQNNFN